MISKNSFNTRLLHLSAPLLPALCAVSLVTGCTSSNASDSTAAPNAETTAAAETSAGSETTAAAEPTSAAAGVRFMIGDMEVYSAELNGGGTLDQSDKVISELSALTEDNCKTASWHLESSADSGLFDFHAELEGDTTAYLILSDCTCQKAALNCSEDTCGCSAEKAASQHFWTLAEAIRADASSINEEAFAYYKTAFALGDETSANYIAEAYVKGAGVEQDVDLGIQWYEKAVNELDLSRAYLNYALLFYNGVKKADGNDGWAYEPNYEKAFDAFLKAYDKGHMKAARYLGLYYEQGLGGVEINCDTAKEWYEKGIESGDITSYGLLGDLYRNQKMGKGSPSVFRETAYGYYTAAIEQNAMEKGSDKDSIAAVIKDNPSPYRQIIFGLGYVWEYGYGETAPDYEEALYWYGLGAGSAPFDEAIDRVNRRLAGEEVEWDTSYGGADKILDTELLSVRKQLAERFLAFDGDKAFTDAKTGITLPYNIFLPEKYEEGKKYPVVLFIHDGSVTGRRIEAPLMQGWGAIIWTTDENQADQECIVVAPVFPESDSGNPTAAVNLMDYLKTKYSFDEDRLYLTGQSFGCIMSFDINTQYPDYFTATLYVSGQWDGVAKEDQTVIAGQKFLYTAAEGDEEAYPGMAAVKAMLTSENTTYGETKFSAALDHSQQNSAVDTMLAEGRNCNFVTFDKGTVTIYGTPKGDAYNEHMYGFDAGYKLDSARSWLLAQTR